MLAFRRLNLEIDPLVHGAADRIRNVRQSRHMFDHIRGRKPQYTALPNECGNRGSSGV